MNSDAADAITSLNRCLGGQRHAVGTNTRCGNMPTNCWDLCLNCWISGAEIVVALPIHVISQTLLTVPDTVWNSGGRKTHQFTVIGTEQPVFMYFDESKIRRILSNLISNALSIQRKEGLLRFVFPNGRTSHTEMHRHRRESQHRNCRTPSIGFTGRPTNNREVASACIW